MRLCRSIDQKLRRFQVYRHLGQLELNALKLGERMPELLPAARIGDRFGQGSASEPDGARADRASQNVQSLQSNFQPASFGPEQAILRHETVIKPEDTDGVRGQQTSFFLDAKTSGIRFDQKSADAFRLGAGIRGREKNVDLR